MPPEHTWHWEPRKLKMKSSPHVAYKIPKSLLFSVPFLSLRLQIKLYFVRVLTWSRFLMKINSSPYEEGWMIKVKPSNPSELESLMGPKEYTKFCEEEDAAH